MAKDGTGTIATTMEKHQNTIGVAAGNDRPLPRYAAKIDRGGLHVLGYRPNGTHLVQALSPLGPTDRSWLCRQQRADGLDFALNNTACECQVLALD